MSFYINRFVFVLVAVLVILLGWYLSDIVAYVLIAAAMWFILTPVVNFLDYTAIKGRSLPRWLATILCMMIFIGFLVGLGWLFIPSAYEQTQILTELDTDQLFDQIESSVAGFEESVKDYGISDNPRQDLEVYVKEKVLRFFDVGEIFGTLFSATGNFIVGLFAVMFITFFFLKDESLVKRIIEGVTPEKHTEKIRRVMSNAKRLLSRYFIGLLIQVTLISTLVTLGLTILGVENALLIGLFAGFINVIPYIGPIIGMTFGLFLVFTAHIQTGLDTSMASLLLQVLVVFLIVQALDNFVFQPLIFSNSVNAHPVEIFLIIFIAGKIGGVAGMVSAIPAYTLIRIIAKEFLMQFKLVQNLTKNI